VNEISPSSRLHSEVVELIPALRSFARTFHRNPSDADDLVQETLVKALANLEHFHEGTRLKSWMFTIMRNTFCTKFRISSREAPGRERCISGEGVIEPTQEWTIRGKELLTAWEILPENYRSILEYVVVDGRSYEDAAVKFGCAVGTVKSRINRARHYLAAKLGENISI
jgi:RNA polymerase sigma factor (sigma-70 family)